LLLLSNLLVFLFVGGGLESLPRKASSEEVQEDVAKSLKIISPGLLAAQVRVDTHITSSSRQRLPLTIRNVLLGLGIAILFGHTKIDDMDDVGSLAAWAPNEKVVWLDVSVDQVFLMDGLDSGELTG